MKKSAGAFGNFIFGFLSFLILLGLFSFSFAQDESLETTLQKLSEDAAKSYISPITSAFGADLNGGWFHKAPSAKIMGLDLEFTIVFMGSFFPDDSKHFVETGQFRFNQDQAKSLVQGQGFTSAVEDSLIGLITSQYFNMEISGATIIGSSTDSIQILFPGKTFEVEGQTYTVPSKTVVLPVAGFGDLSDVNILPFFAPQFSIGTIFGTQATFRFIPSIEINKDLGKFKYFGFGIQHNPGIWFANPLPVNVAASFFTQTLEIGSLFKTTTRSFGINASKSFGAGPIKITPYAGFMLKKATMTVTYDYVVTTPDNPTGEVKHISFDLEGENKSRITIGAALRLLMLNINADYNIGKYNSITAGISFGF